MAPWPPAGELGSLEEVVKEFIHKEFLRPIMLHELWQIASNAYQAWAQRAPGAERCAMPRRQAGWLAAAVKARQLSELSNHAWGAWGWVAN